MMILIMSVHNDYDELYEMFKEFHSKFEALLKKLADLKKENSIIYSKCEILQKENLNFKNEISTLKKGKEKEISNTLMLKNDKLKDKLKDKVKNLTNSLTKFINGRDNLDKLLGMQICIFLQSRFRI